MMQRIHGVESTQGKNERLPRVLPLLQKVDVEAADSYRTVHLSARREARAYARITFRKLKLNFVSF
jgi:hypothetical protein